jgi:hypothetical protein
MTRQQETGMVVIVGVIILAFLFLTSCSTKKTITEYVAVHDTLIVTHTDTLMTTKVQTVRDTITNTEVHTYTLNNVGDTVKEIHHYHNSERTIVVDSTDRYKATVDSLRAAMRAQESVKEVKVTNRPRWWEYIVLVAFCVAWIFGISIAVKIWRNKK